MPRGNENKNIANVLGDGDGNTQQPQPKRQTRKKYQLAAQQKTTTNREEAATQPSGHDTAAPSVGRPPLSSPQARGCPSVRRAAQGCIVGLLLCLGYMATVGPAPQAKPNARGNNGAQKGTGKGGDMASSLSSSSSSLLLAPPTREGNALLWRAYNEEATTAASLSRGAKEKESAATQPLPTFPSALFSALRDSSERCWLPSVLRENVVKGGVSNNNGSKGEALDHAVCLGEIPLSQRDLITNSNSEGKSLSPLPISTPPRSMLEQYPYLQTILCDGGNNGDGGWGRSRSSNENAAKIFGGAISPRVCAPLPLNPSSPATSSTATTADARKAEKASAYAALHQRRLSAIGLVDSHQSEAASASDASEEHVSVLALPLAAAEDEAEDAAAEHNDEQRNSNNQPSHSGSGQSPPSLPLAVAMRRAVRRNVRSFRAYYHSLFVEAERWASGGGMKEGGSSIGASEGGDWLANSATDGPLHFSPRALPAVPTSFLSSCGGWGEGSEAVWSRKAGQCAPFGRLQKGRKGKGGGEDFNKEVIDGLHRTPKVDSVAGVGSGGGGSGSGSTTQWRPPPRVATNVAAERTALLFSIAESGTAAGHLTDTPRRWAWGQRPPRRSVRPSPPAPVAESASAAKALVFGPPSTYEALRTVLSDGLRGLSAPLGVNRAMEDMNTNEVNKGDGDQTQKKKHQKRVELLFIGDSLTRFAFCNVFAWLQNTMPPPPLNPSNSKSQSYSSHSSASSSSPYEPLPPSGGRPLASHGACDAAGLNGQSLAERRIDTVLRGGASVEALLDRVRRQWAAEVGDDDDDSSIISTDGSNANVDANNGLRRLLGGVRRWWRTLWWRLFGRGPAPSTSYSGGDADETNDEALDEADDEPLTITLTFFASPYFGEDLATGAFYNAGPGRGIELVLGRYFDMRSGIGGGGATETKKKSAEGVAAPLPSLVFVGRGMWDAIRLASGAVDARLYMRPDQLKGGTVGGVPQSASPQNPLPPSVYAHNAALAHSSLLTERAVAEGLVALSTLFPSASFVLLGLQRVLTPKLSRHNLFTICAIAGSEHYWRARIYAGGRLYEGFRRLQQQQSLLVVSSSSGAGGTAQQTSAAATAPPPPPQLFYLDLHSLAAAGNLHHYSRKDGIHLIHPQAGLLTVLAAVADVGARRSAEALYSTASAKGEAEGEGGSKGNGGAATFVSEFSHRPPPFSPQELWRSLFAGADPVLDARALNLDEATLSNVQSIELAIAAAVAAIKSPSSSFAGTTTSGASTTTDKEKAAFLLFQRDAFLSHAATRALIANASEGRRLDALFLGHPLNLQPRHMAGRLRILLFSEEVEGEGKEGGEGSELRKEEDGNVGSNDGGKSSALVAMPSLPRSEPALANRHCPPVIEGYVASQGVDVRGGPIISLTSAMLRSVPPAPQAKAQPQRGGSLSPSPSLSDSSTSAPSTASEGNSQDPPSGEAIRNGDDLKAREEKNEREEEKEMEEEVPAEPVESAARRAVMLSSLIGEGEGGRVRLGRKTNGEWGEEKLLVSFRQSVAGSGGTAPATAAEISGAAAIATARASRSVFGALSAVHSATAFKTGSDQTASALNHFLATSPAAQHQRALVERSVVADALLRRLLAPAAAAAAKGEGSAAVLAEGPRGSTKEEGCHAVAITMRLHHATFTSPTSPHNSNDNAASAPATPLPLFSVDFGEDAIGRGGERKPSKPTTNLGGNSGGEVEVRVGSLAACFPRLMMGGGTPNPKTDPAAFTLRIDRSAVTRGGSRGGGGTRASNAAGASSAPASGDGDGGHSPLSSSDFWVAEAVGHFGAQLERLLATALAELATPQLHAVDAQMVL